MTLRENNLKEIEGGTILESQGILVANKRSLLERPGLLRVSAREGQRGRRGDSAVERPGGSMGAQAPARRGARQPLYQQLAGGEGRECPGTAPGDEGRLLDGMER